MKVELVVSLLLSPLYGSYIPPYYSGLPTASRVVSLDPPDYRGEESYRIDFTLDTEPDRPQQGFVHRTWAKPRRSPTGSGP